MQPKALALAATVALVLLSAVSAGCAARDAKPVTAGANGAGDSTASIPATASAGWRVQDLGQANMGTAPVWSDRGLAWAYDDESVPGAVMVWDAAQGRVKTLLRLPQDSGADVVSWYQGRVFWSQWVDGPGRTLRQAVFSMAPGEKKPTRLLTRPEIGKLIVAAERLVWTERDSHSKQWSLHTMRLSDRKPQTIARLGSAPVDICLSEQMLAWVPSSGARSISVRALDSKGRLAAKSRSVSMNDTDTTDYQPGSLTIDGDRIAWSASQYEAMWHVFTWRLGDAAAARISVGPSFNALEMEGLVRPAVSGQRVVWATWNGFETAVLMWTSGESSPTIVASHADDLAVSVPDVSGDRVAWAVSRESDDGDEVTSAGTIVTWTATERSVQAVSPPIAGLDAELYCVPAVDGDRITYLAPHEIHDYWVYLAERTP